MWILIDNYDSFTFMLFHYLKELHQDIRVYRNDEVSIKGIEGLGAERIILSPGPKRPCDAGAMLDIIDRFHDKIPILGVCLGHQALGEYWGCSLQRAIRPRHGKIDYIEHENVALFAGVPKHFPVMRYHSLVLKAWESSPIEPLAFSIEGELMAMRHERYPSYGLQFHPESIGTQHGARILRNWHDEITAIV